MEAQIKEEQAKEPSRSPINTPVIRYHSEELDKRSVAANVLITGDRHTGRSRRAKIIAEDMMASGTQILTISYCSSYGRLGLTPSGQPNGKKIHVINRNTPGLSFAPDHGTAIGQIVANTDTSFAIDISCFQPDGVAEFLQGLFSQIPIGKRKPLCIILDDLDASIARRRNGVDSQALKDFYATITRGPDMGVSVVTVTRSPSEIPVEIRNGVGTFIAHRTTAEPHIQALAVVFDKGLVTYHDVEAFGIRFIPDGDAWIRPLVERLQDTPFYYPLRDLRTGAGDKSDYDGEGGSELSGIVSTIRKNTKKRKKSGKVAKTTSQKRTKTVSAAPSYQRGQKQMAVETLKAEGAKYYIERVATASAILSYRNPGIVLDKDLVLDIARRQDTLDSAAWGSNYGRRFLQMSPAVAGTLHRIISDISPEQADAFFAGVRGDIEIAADDARMVLRERLASSALKNHDMQRLGLAIYAWNKFLANEKVKQLRVGKDLPQANRPAGEVVEMPQRTIRLAA